MECDIVWALRRHALELEALRRELMRTQPCEHCKLRVEPGEAMAAHLLSECRKVPVHSRDDHDEALQGVARPLEEAMRVLCGGTLDFDDAPALARTFSAFFSTEGGVAAFSPIVRAHIAEMGRGIIAWREDAINDAISKTNDGKESNAADLEYIFRFIGLHRRCTVVETAAFGSNELLQAARREAFEDVFNCDAGQQRSNAEMLATYCDACLTSPSGADAAPGSGGADDDAAPAPGCAGGCDHREAQLDSIVQLLSYLADKEVFGEFYRELLAKRLLSHQRSAPADDAENSMLAKLRRLCGPSFTLKMEYLTAVDID